MPRDGDGSAEPREINLTCARCGSKFTWTFRLNQLVPLYCDPCIFAGYGGDVLTPYQKTDIRRGKTKRFSGDGFMKRFLT